MSECSGWAKQFDDVLVAGVQSLVDSSLREDQREQIFLRLADGGLGFASAAHGSCLPWKLGAHVERGGRLRWRQLLGGLSRQVRTFGQ